MSKYIMFRVEEEDLPFKIKRVLMFREHLLSDLPFSLLLLREEHKKD